MRFYYAGVLLACISSTLLVQTTYSKTMGAVKSPIRHSQLKSEADFCDKVVNEIKDILTNNNLSSAGKVSKIKALAEAKFDIDKITTNATSQITKKHKMSDQELSNLKSAIMTYLYNKYVKLTSDYNGATNIVIKKLNTTTQNGLQQSRYVIQASRGNKLPVSVFVQDKKITDIIFNNASLINPKTFAEKLDNKFNGNVKNFTRWLEKYR